MTTTIDFSRLTGREREVLYLSAAGLSYKLSARHLGISEQTVKNHITSILDKLDACDKAHAVCLACKGGLL